MPPFSPPPDPYPYNLNNELAKERSRAAAERTLMAWIRTALSLIGFGFGIDRIVAAVQSSRLAGSDRVDLSVRLLSIGFIAIGNLALLVAVLQHEQVLKRLRRNDFRYDPPIPIATITAISLLMVGTLALLTLISG
jgi:putative membrane protein